jgi:hypothetical protein
VKGSPTVIQVSGLVMRMVGQHLGGEARAHIPRVLRRVMVEPTGHAHDVSRALFADLLAGIRELLGAYSEADLAVIISFLVGTRAVFATQIDAFRSSRTTPPIAPQGARAHRPRPARPAS